jgi:hypothetical protein
MRCFANSLRTSHFEHLFHSLNFPFYHCCGQAQLSSVRLDFSAIRQFLEILESSGSLLSRETPLCEAMTKLGRGEEVVREFKHLIDGKASKLPN